MRIAFLAIGFLMSVCLSLFLGYRHGFQSGFQYTEKFNDIDHATGLMRTYYDSALESYTCFLKLEEAETNSSIGSVKAEVRQSVLYSITDFREQVDRIRKANINYPLVDIYEPQVNEMEIDLLQ